MMLTPTSVARVWIEESRRARLIIDHGGLFIAVDGDGPLQRRVVASVLDAAMAEAEPGASRMGPSITPLSPLPVCHGSVIGVLREGAGAALSAILTSAGFTLG